MNILKNDWNEVIGEEFSKPYYQELRSFLKKEYESHTIYPSMHDLFNALNYTPFTNTKVVILGQDPYHGPNQAHGLSFSVKPGVKVPPSLQNMYKELHTDIGCEIPHHGYLVPWAEQGVLLLNTVLTVRKGEAATHKGKGWEMFTDSVIRALNERAHPVIFVLWGKHAQAKQELITNERHPIITAAHPSPFSAHRGFFGTRPFSKINQLLEEMGDQPINWQL
ncbi:uracil-DNA glycosylase [Halalkalibacter nanhaiisediminis]|uniref:Uracil-DNA glycosylase n=1 Tax=Halalkalibacter nanhaiisediminis TaxID=688079 RepID=A0A562QSJ1_9BACI|nr:uracil-DNA glycosylase [Halalkalibacter nanhaiisediminis]TWI59719.1 uracil-DNA glycosylase [Halalkalibacter nanhaiisediminis]